MRALKPSDLHSRLRLRLSFLRQHARELQLNRRTNHRGRLGVLVEATKQQTLMNVPPLVRTQDREGVVKPSYARMLIEASQASRRNLIRERPPASRIMGRLAQSFRRRREVGQHAHRFVERRLIDDPDRARRLCCRLRCQQLGKTNEQMRLKFLNDGHCALRITQLGQLTLRSSLEQFLGLREGGRPQVLNRLLPPILLAEEGRTAFLQEEHERLIPMLGDQEVPCLRRLVLSPQVVGDLAEYTLQMLIRAGRGARR